MAASHSHVLHCVRVDIDLIQGVHQHAQRRHVDYRQLGVDGGQLRCQVLDAVALEAGHGVDGGLIQQAGGEGIRQQPAPLRRYCQDRFCLHTLL